MKTLRLVQLKTIPEDEDLRRQWDALVARVDRPQVFYTYEWALAVERAYGASLLPLVFLAYDESESLCGVAALATDSAANNVSFLCASTGDYCDFVSSPERRPAFVHAVIRELKRQGLTRMALANLPADSATLAAVREATRQHEWFCFARGAYVCAQVCFDKLERHKNGKPVAPGLKRIRRFVNAMRSRSPVHFDHSRSWDAVDPVLPQFIEAHVARFLEIGRISNLAHPRRREFLAELAKLLAGRQWFVLSRMMAGDRVVAWHYGFQFHDAWFWYQPTFDSSVERFWPGFCLLSQVIQDAIENPALKMLDLGLGSEAYKAKFANESRQTLHVSVHRSVLAHGATVLRYQAARAARAIPAIERLALAGRQKVRTLRGHLQEQGAWLTLIWLARHLLRLLWARDEVFFYEWAEEESFTALRDVRLHPLDLHQLARAAMEYAEDEDTAAYLLRSAQRLRAGDCEGFALTDNAGRPVHFAWTAPFDGFFCAELNDRLRASPDSVLIFDCWTAGVARERGYYAQTVTLVAKQILKQGRMPWIFCVASNARSVRGLEKSGFRHRYSLVRQRLLGWQRIKGQVPSFSQAPRSEVSAGV